MGSQQHKPSAAQAVPAQAVPAQETATGPAEGHRQPGGNAFAAAMLGLSGFPGALVGSALLDEESPGPDAKATGPAPAVPDAKAAPTTPDEAKVLNAVRESPRRLDPLWLMAAQNTLTVKPSGIFDTATLRAMRVRANNPALGSKALLAEDFLVGLAPGAPFMEAASGKGPGKRNPNATLPADVAAQSIGYASHAAYVKTWVPLKILDVTLKQGGGNPALAARLNAASAFLRAKYPNMKDNEIRGAIGWSGDGNGAYAYGKDSVDKGLAHLHTMGLALDIDPRKNPWIFRGKQGGKASADDWYEKFFEYASKIYGGEPITAAKMHKWGEEGSTEEMFEKLQTSNEGVQQYLELAKQSDADIAAALAGAGLPNGKDMVKKVRTHAKIFHSSSRKQQQADGFMNLGVDLVVALRDAAGLAWGGADISGNENGDFMHFDMRNAGLGKTVYGAARGATKAFAKTQAKPEPAK